MRRTVTVGSICLFLVVIQGLKVHGNRHKLQSQRGLPGGTSGKERTCQCRRLKGCLFNPWVGKIPWNRKWQPPPVFLPGKFHGQRSLIGYGPWACKESGMTEYTQHTQNHNLSFPSKSIFCNSPSPSSLPLSPSLNFIAFSL